MQTSLGCKQVVILQISLLWYACNQSRLQAGLFESDCSDKSNLLIINQFTNNFNFRRFYYEN